MADETNTTDTSEETEDELTSSSLNGQLSYKTTVIQKMLDSVRALMGYTTKDELDDTSKYISVNSTGDGEVYRKDTYRNLELLNDEYEQIDYLVNKLYSYTNEITATVPLFSVGGLTLTENQSQFITNFKTNAKIYTPTLTIKQGNNEYPFYTSSNANQVIELSTNSSYPTAASISSNYTDPVGSSTLYKAFAHNGIIKGIVNDAGTATWDASNGYSGFDYGSQYDKEDDDEYEEYINTCVNNHNTEVSNYDYQLPMVANVDYEPALGGRNLVTSDEIQSGAVSQEFTVNIPVVGWTLANDGVFGNIYQCTVSVNGITSSDNPIVTLDMSNIDYTSRTDNPIESYAGLLDVFSQIYRVDTGDNEITIYSRNTGITGLRLRLLCIRK